VQTVKESVQTSVDTVKDTVSSSVETVKETLDVRLQVQRHPWAMFGGSVALGFVAGWALNRMLRASHGNAIPPGYTPPSYTGLASNAPLRASQSFREEARSTPTFSSGASSSETSSPPAAPGPSWLDEVTRTFAPEMGKLKGLAIGTAMGVVRDLVTEHIPDQLKPRLDELIDNVTSKLGGEPVRGHLLDELREQWQSPHNGHQRTPEGAQA